MAPIATGGSRITFGMVPTRDDDGTRATMKRICDALGTHARMEVVPHRAPSPPALASAMRAKRVQVAWMSPTLFLLSDQLAGAVPILSSVRRGQTSYHAVLFARADAGIATIAECATRTVAWVATSSASGYIVSRMSLARRGMDLAKTFASEMFCDSHTGVVRAVLERRADVGATFAVFEGGRTERAPIQAGWMGVTDRPMRILDVAGPIPSDLVVTASDVSPAMRSALSAAFRRVVAHPVDGEPIRSLVGADDFVPFSPTALHALTELVTSGRAAGAIRPIDAP